MIGAISDDSNVPERRVRGRFDLSESVGRRAAARRAQGLWARRHSCAAQASALLWAAAALAGDAGCWSMPMHVAENASDRRWRRYARLAEGVGQPRGGLGVQGRALVEHLWQEVLTGEEVERGLRWDCKARSFVAVHRGQVGGVGAQTRANVGRTEQAYGSDSRGLYRLSQAHFATTSQSTSENVRL